MSVYKDKDKDDNHAKSNPKSTEKEQETPKGVESPQTAISQSDHSQTPNILQSPYRGFATVPQPTSTQASQLQKASIPSLSTLNESIQRPQSALTAPSSPQKTISDPGLLTLLGPNVSSFPFSESAFIEAMKLRTEQERTKQEFYRAESANKNLNIIQLALQAQLPPGQIAQLLAGGIPGSSDDTRPNVQSPYQIPSHASPPYPQPFRWTPQQSAPPRLSSEQQIQMIQAQQRQIQLNLQQQQQQQQQQYMQLSQSQQGPQVTPNTTSRLPQKRATSTDSDLGASPMQPKGFKFGGNVFPTTAQERPQSPAKIGANAVANLNAPTTPFRVPKSATSSTGRRTRGHQRYNSMPVSTSMGESASSSRTGSLRHEFQVPAKASPFLQSPSGATSTLQVNPIPAQPLNEQKKQQTQPSQESMQSFQHVIQFHHWQPESGATSSSTNKSPSHKRHKSITKDANSSTYHEGQNYATGTPSEKGRVTVADEDVDDPDSSVDTSIMETATKKDESAHPPSRGHSRQESNVGRYPHDILTANK